MVLIERDVYSLDKGVDSFEGTIKMGLPWGDTYIFVYSNPKRNICPRAFAPPQFVTLYDVVVRAEWCAQRYNLGLDHTLLYEDVSEGAARNILRGSENYLFKILREGILAIKQDSLDDVVDLEYDYCEDEIERIITRLE